MDNSTYTLNSVQFEQALAIVDRERRANTPTPRQERAAKLLSIAIYGLALGPLLLFLLALWSTPDSTTPEEIFRGVIPVPVLLVLIAGAWVAVLSIGITILFFLNLRYVRQLRRQRTLARELGLLETLHAPWRAERQKKRLRTVLDFIVRMLALLLVPAYFALFGYMVVESGMKRHLIFWFIGLLSFVFVTVVGAIIVTYFTRRSRARLDLISQLHSSLEESKQVEGDATLPIQISSATYEKIAQIERAQISLQRVQSIMRAPDEAGVGYVLQKSREANEAQAKLDPSTRVRVQDWIDALTAEPRPPGVVEDPQRGVLRLSVPDTPVTIRFTVDEQNRRIQIYSVEPEESRG